MELDYVLAGYRVATRTDRQDWQEAGLPGPSLLSLSDCVVDLVPVDSSGWDHWFASPQEAEIARNQAGNSGLHVLGVGFAAADVPGLQADMADGGWDGSLPERLIQDEQDARRAAQWLTDSGLGNPKVFLWAAALLTEPPRASLQTEE